MAVPAKKVTSRRRKNRNSHLIKNLDRYSVENCLKCGKVRRLHSLCKNCFHTYRGENLQFYFKKKSPIKISNKTADR